MRTLKLAAAVSLAALATGAMAYLEVGQAIDAAVRAISAGR